MPSKRVVHISEVLEYKKCRRLWSYTSRMGQCLQPRSMYAPFFIGQGVHHCIEHLISDGVAPTTSLAQFLRPALADRRKGDTWREEVPEISKQVRLMRAMLEQYEAWAKHASGPLCDANLDYIAHEVRFDDGENADWPAVRLEINGQPLLPEVWIAGRFDGLARRRSDDTVWLVEHKTCRGIEERSKLLPHDEQATAYAYVAGKLFDEPVTGIIYTLLRKKIAQRPKVLQDGHLSRARSIDTSPELFRKAILEHYGPISEREIQARFGDLLRYLDDFVEPFVVRVAIKRTPQQIEQYVRELHTVALEMYDPNTPKYANRTYTCPSCKFRSPCLVQDTGDMQEVQMMLKLQYIPRKVDDPIAQED